ncbi:glycosyltransferase family 2 protein, partial [uncultured Alistipes sp.]|uniref:glycosyltransferase family 2 protein n=1 Tax=uncultured Alistipes sp. TaxID=538949 RepID=UPI002589354F
CPQVCQDGLSSFQGMLIIVPAMLMFLVSYLRIGQYKYLGYRLTILASLLLFVVLFSSGSEVSGYVIASLGAGIWWVTLSPPRRGWLEWLLLALVLFASFSYNLLPTKFYRGVFMAYALRALPFAAVWLHCIWRLWREDFAATDLALGYGPRPTQDDAFEEPRPAQPGDTLDIVCPCYNPQPGFVGSLAHGLEELRGFYPDKQLHLIVVNDGSPRNFGDEQRAALRQAVPGVEIVDIPHGGKGAAIRAGIACSRAPYTIYTDIDMPYTAESMREVVDRVFAGEDVVIAVRNRSYHSRLSPVRKLMSYGSKMLNRIFLNIRHTDTQGGLKGLSPRARAVMLRTRISDFLFDTEFVVLAARDKRLRIGEVETSLRDGIVMSKMSGRVLFRELRNFFRIAIRL